MIREDAAKGVVSFDVIVKPSAVRTEVWGLDPVRHGIVVRVAAKPTEGAANAELLRFLASRLEVPSSSLRIVGGHRSRRKTIAVRGLSQDGVEQRLGLRSR